MLGERAGMFLMEDRKQSCEFRSISGSPRLGPAPAGESTFRGSWAGHCWRVARGCKNMSEPRGLGDARWAPSSDRPGLSQQGGLQNALGPRDPLSFLSGLLGPSNPHKHGWMGPRGTAQAWAASSGPPRAALFSADVKPAPPLGEPWAWWGGLGAGLPTLVPRHLSRQRAAWSQQREASGCLIALSLVSPGAHQVDGPGIDLTPNLHPPERRLELR